MSSILRWVAGKVSSTTNSAAESVCRRVIKRFLEEPISEDTFSLELFDDWTAHLKMKRVFLDVNLVNKYVPLIVFKSIYTSGVRFDARYNLSKFDVIFDRILLEVELDEPKEIEAVDEDLTASIQEIKDQLPVKTENGWQNWFLEKVKQVLFKMSSLTVILRVAHLKDLKLVFEDLDCKYNTPSVTASLKWLAVHIGEKKNLEELLSVQHVTCELADNEIKVRIDEIKSRASHDSVKTVLAILEKVTKLVPPTASSSSSSSTKLTIQLFIKKLELTTTNSLSFVLTNLKANVSDSASVEFDSVEIHHRETVILSLKSNKSLIDLMFPDQQQQLTMFHEIPKGSFNAMKLAIRIPSIVVNITNEFVDSVVDTVCWFAIPNAEPPKHMPIGKSSIFVSLEVPEISLRVSSISVSMKTLRSRVWFSKTPAASQLHAGLDIGLVGVSLSERFSILQFTNERKTNVSARVSLIDALGRDRVLKVDGHLGSALIRIPNDLSFIPAITSLIPRSESHEVSKPGTPVHIDVHITTSRLYLDYMTLKLPARVLVSIEQTLLGVSGQTEDPKLEFETSLKLYMSNTRTDLPMSAFCLKSFPHDELNFAELVSCKLGKTEITRNTVTVASVSLHAGFCLDSVKLLIAFMMHIQYHLDNPAEHQHTQMRHIEEPDHLLALTQTLTQSLNVAGIEYREHQVSNEPRVFNSVEQLISSVRMETEESICFDEDDFAGSISSSGPSQAHSMLITVNNINVDAQIHGGHDYPEIWNLQELTSIPLITRYEYRDDTDFDIVTNRDDFNYLQLSASGNCSVAMYDNDPSVALRVHLVLNNFAVFDNIHNSASRVLFGTDEPEKNAELIFDVHTTSEISLQITLPNMAMFITQEQINFFISLVKSCKLPAFPSDEIVDEPPSFQLFELKPSRFHISAHFRLWLDVHLDDIDIKLPECSLFALRGLDNLIGALAEFYVAEVSRPGAAAVIGGLPVIKNLRRITAAVRDLFAFDVQKYGVAVGFGRSFTALMQIIAAETLNAGANAATIAERFLSIAMKMLSGKRVCDEALRTGIATLIIRSSKEGKLMKSVPAIVLAPGVLSFHKLNELMKKMRDKVNPNLKKKQKYSK